MRGERHLVIGGDGLIGGAIATELIRGGAEVLATSRRCDGDALHFLDLLTVPAQLPDLMMHSRVAYLCAGVNGFAQCEGNRESWRVNVDGVIRVAERLHGAANAWLRRWPPTSGYWVPLDLPFLVYVSSDAVEWSGNAYARQRATAETALRGIAGDRLAILRAGKVTATTVQSFAKFAISIGCGGVGRVYQWSSQMGCV